MQDEKKLDKHAAHYSKDNLFKKLLKYGKVAGIKVTYAVLLLFYSLSKPDLPAKVKGTIVGALGYFIFPMDLVSDLVPIAGYADDLGVLLAALGIAAFYIDDDVKKKAKAKLKDLFGDYDEKELRDIESKISN
ncbi:DUF1232 domain-containing protein [Tissierella creatinini]|nr:DUF1232 domain-containing protein [Tissierella creatinini]TJX62912.1 DUF1232 domain-containing protein [Soehngenia saccharolytica]